MARTKNEVEGNANQLADSVKAALDEAEGLLKKAASETGDRASELRDQAMESLKKTRLALYDVQDSVVEKSRQAARVTDDYVHDNPWKAIAVSAVAGLVLGVLISRR